MPRIYYGWAVVTATIITYTLIMGATYSSYGLFVLPISKDLGLSRANANTGIIIMNLGMMMQAPLLGMLLDRVPARRIMILSSLLFIASFAVLARSHSFWVNGAVLALSLPFAFKGAGSLTAPLLIVRWFTVQRGRALAISQLGLSLGGLLLPPVVAALIEHQGWRNALLVTGASCGALLLAISLVLRERPGPNDREPGAVLPAAASERPVARGPGPVKIGAILRTSQFWTINLSCGLVAAMSSALLITLAPLAREEGLSMMQAASLVSVMSGFSIASMLLLALVADRIDRIVLLTILFVVGSAFSLTLTVSHTYALLVSAAAAMGLIQGATVPTQYALLADRFGAASYGVVTGLTVPLVAGLGMITIRYGGEVFDRTGDYGALFMTFAVLQLVAAGTIFVTRFTRARAALATP